MTTPTRPVLVVDGANVVGAVPDGWWRDRPGAAARLQRALAGVGQEYASVLLVVEGEARGGAPAGVADRVTTVHARGSGDDEIVAQCRALRADGTPVVLATADRGLIARVVPFGVEIIGPRRVPRR